MFGSDLIKEGSLSLEHPYAFGVVAVEAAGIAVAVLEASDQLAARHSGCHPIKQLALTVDEALRECLEP